LATRLSGRTIAIRIMPFNFSEYCEFQKLENSEMENEALLHEYIRWGGFSLVCQAKAESNKGEVDFIAEKGKEKFYVQSAYLLSDEIVVTREFGAFSDIRDNYPKYVITMDPLQMNRDGVIHLNLIDFLLGGERKHGES